MIIPIMMPMFGSGEGWELLAKQFPILPSILIGIIVYLLMTLFYLLVVLITEKEYHRLNLFGKILFFSVMLPYWIIRRLF